MALLPIVIYPAPILKRVADPIESITPQIKQLLSDMADTMYEAPGIGLAAPQVGYSVRAVVVDVGHDDEEDPRPGMLLKLVNPEIIEFSGTTDYEEGCLSIPDIREKVKRHAEIKVRALNENGEEIVIEADGLLSICLQHEIDHLNGILFVDRLTSIRKELIKKKLLKLAAS